MLDQSVDISSSPSAGQALAQERKNSALKTVPNPRSSQAWMMRHYRFQSLVTRQVAGYLNWVCVQVEDASNTLDNLRQAFVVG